ncbi:MAG: monovalent cation/H+ antiporter complex subunit F [Acidothermaceae bacterium]
MTTVWYIASIALLIGGLVPAVLLGSRGGPTDRLVGLMLGSAVAVLALLTMAQAYAQSSYLIVPLVLAVLSTTGVLVFTRLLGPR